MVQSVGGIKNVEFTSGMLHAARQASSKRREAIEEMKKKESEEANRSKTTLEAVNKLESKKRKLLQQVEEEASALQTEIDLEKKRLRQIIVDMCSLICGVKLRPPPVAAKNNSQGVRLHRIIALAVICADLLDEINMRNLKLQSEDITLEIEKENTAALRDEVNDIRDMWPIYVGSATHIAAGLGVPAEFEILRILQILNTFLLFQCYTNCDYLFCRESILNEIFAHSILGKHPNILRYHAAWTENKLIYIQNEFCVGGSLKDLIIKRKSKEKNFSQEELYAILVHVSKGLRYIHSLNLAHLNLKSATVLIQKEKMFPLLDGSSHADTGHVTNVENPKLEKGDFRYLPREIQKEDFSQVTKADIFSLGPKCSILSLDVIVENFGDNVRISNFITHCHTFIHTDEVHKEKQDQE
uniref:Protein kinase domain-containing protein n=1 Tax=Timema monikensis TaxID=170555 RepID=A0A7R9E662_9NEOP|nr:unnamed protein product [Timema monikensis]